MGYLTESRTFDPRENIEDTSNDKKPNLIKKTRLLLFRYSR